MDEASAPEQEDKAAFGGDNVASVGWTAAVHDPVLPD